MIRLKAGKLRPARRSLDQPLSISSLFFKHMDCDLLLGLSARDCELVASCWSCQGQCQVASRKLEVVRGFCRGSRAGHGKGVYKETISIYIYLKTLSFCDHACRDCLFTPNQIVNGWLTQQFDLNQLRSRARNLGYLTEVYNRSMQQ